MSDELESLDSTSVEESPSIDNVVLIDNTPIVPIQTLEDILSARQAAYQRESDPLFFDYQQGKCSKNEWLTKIEEIKMRYPKPISDIEEN